MFTAVFINQAFMNTMGSSKPNTTSRNPNWSQCLQCVAIDRAVAARSDFFAQCFDSIAMIRPTLQALQNFQVDCFHS